MVRATADADVVFLKGPVAVRKLGRDGTERIDAVTHAAVRVELGSGAQSRASPDSVLRNGNLCRNPRNIECL